MDEKAALAQLTHHMSHILQEQPLLFLAAHRSQQQHASLLLSTPPAKGRKGQQGRGSSHASSTAASSTEHPVQALEALLVSMGVGACPRGLLQLNTMSAFRMAELRGSWQGMLRWLSEQCTHTSLTGQHRRCLEELQHICCTTMPSNSALSALLQLMCALVQPISSRHKLKAGLSTMDWLVRQLCQCWHDSGTSQTDNLRASIGHGGQQAGEGSSSQEGGAVAPDLTPLLHPLQQLVAGGRHLAEQVSRAWPAGDRQHLMSVLQQAQDASSQSGCDPRALSVFATWLQRRPADREVLHRAWASYSGMIGQVFSAAKWLVRVGQRSELAQAYAASVLGGKPQSAVVKACHLRIIITDLLQPLEPVEKELVHAALLPVQAGGSSSHRSVQLG